MTIAEYARRIDDIANGPEAQELRLKSTISLIPQSPLLGGIGTKQSEERRPGSVAPFAVFRMRHVRAPRLPARGGVGIFCR